jgi:hypothetical protein
MFSPMLAAALRDRGHTVVSVAERLDLRALADPDVFAWAVAEPAWLLTENVKDFRPILLQASQSGTVLPDGFGLLFTSSRTFPPSRNNPAPLVDALHAWLAKGPPGPPIVEDWLTTTTS